MEQFPLFERDPETGALVFAHHPFTSPHPDDRARFLAGETEAVRALHYDVVYNGNELGSGSIRITDPTVQLRVFEVLGMHGTRRGDGSGSCSTRWPWAHRRTAALRSGSTAWRCCSRAPRACAT